MRFVKQAILHDPDNGIVGDCFRTAIGCILDIDPSEFPHSHEPMRSQDQDRMMNEALAARGLALAQFGFTDLDSVFEVMCHSPDVPYVLSGESPRATFHAVVAQGRDLIWDPHPSNGFLVGPERDSERYMVSVLAIARGGGDGR